MGSEMCIRDSSVNSDSVNYAFCQVRILSNLILSTTHSVKSDSVNYASVNSVLSSLILSNHDDLEKMLNMKPLAILEQ